MVNGVGGTSQFGVGGAPLFSSPDSPIVTSHDVCTGQREIYYSITGTEVYFLMSLCIALPIIAVDEYTLMAILTSFDS